LIVHSILIWLLHLLLKSSSHGSLVVMIVHIWHHIRVDGVIGGEVLIRVESCQLRLDVVYLPVVLRQHILHGVQLVGIRKQLSNSRAITTLGAVCVPHRPEAHEVWHIGHICHAILEVVKPIEVIISLANLHIIERESLRHLIRLSVLSKLLLVGKEILICILTIIQITIGSIRCPLILDRLLIIVVLFWLLLLLWHQLGHIGSWTLVLDWIGTLIWSLILLRRICICI